MVVIAISPSASRRKVAASYTGNPPSGHANDPGTPRIGGTPLTVIWLFPGGPGSPGLG